MENQEFRWNGTVIDANGRQASVSAVIHPRKDSAAFQLQTFPDDITSEVLSWNASLEGQSPTTGVRLKGEDKVHDGVCHWEIDLDPADPDVFAKAALLGRYNVKTEGVDPGIALTKGIMIIWRFESMLTHAL